ncbi:hypothetical protein L2E82_39698 [Cichorium intybus]|uniref:Uncharacterized protein n=1 Tax=Cichorium intybus TaxID=13427 RepID=A0ACB9AJX7_CICIN|nr:hypothetical protein L2E82_39698 [Cichorium intybus]
MGKGAQNYGKKDNIGKASSSSSSNPNSYPAWAKEVHECEKKYKVDRNFGLSDSEVEKQLEIHGLNELEKHEGPSVFRLILDQFNDTLVRILLVAAVISFVLACYDGEEGGEMEITTFVEPLVIFLIVIVIRNGRIVSTIPAKELVPGDIVELRVGDKVPA